jgi:hypothetical protein
MLHINLLSILYRVQLTMHTRATSQTHVTPPAGIELLMLPQLLLHGLTGCMETPQPIMSWQYRWSGLVQP